MQIKQTHFYSDGNRLDAVFYGNKIDNWSKKASISIIMSGFTGLYRIHPARFARFLTEKGHRCFSFDYRGFGASEGARGNVVLEEQVRDVRSSIQFVSSHDFVQDGRICLIGWGMGAGVVLSAAFTESKICAIAALNGFYDGRRFLQFHFQNDQGKAYESKAQSARLKSTTTGAWPLANAFEIYPLDKSSEAYVDDELKKFEDYFDHKFSMAFADSLLHWKPEAYATIIDVPLWLAHGTNNRLHPLSEAESLAGLYAGEKTVHSIEGAGHTEWMFDEHSVFREVANELSEWLCRVAPPAT